MDGTIRITARWRGLVLIAAIVPMLGLLGWLGTRPAAAHAFVDHSDPAANAILATPPQQITIWFTERLEYASSDAQLFDQNGKPVAGVKSRPGDDPKVLIVDIPTTLPNGTYSVLWTTLSKDDGHEAQGYFAFTVGTQANVQVVVPPSIGSVGPPAWLQTGSRWIAFLGLAAALAIWPVWLVVLRPAISPAWQAGPRLTRRVRGLAAGAILLALAGNLVALLVQADAGSGGYLHQIVVTLRDTRYGRLWLLRIGLLFAYAAVLMIAAWWWPWRRKVEAATALALAAALPIPFSLIAHASAQPAGRTTAVAFDVLHLLAASLWVGGLFLLVGALVPTLRDLTPAGRRAVLVRAIPRFSLLALTAWGVLGLTGLYSAWLQVGNWTALRTTAYGHTLTIKILLLIPLLALGAFNLLLVTRRIRRADGAPEATNWSRHFAQAIGVEVVLVVAVLLVVGRLTSEAPAREVVAARSGQAILHLDADGRSATLSVAPATPGQNHIRLDLAGSTLPAPTTALLRVSLPSQNTGQTDIPLVRAAGNAFEGHAGELSIIGDWSVETIVRVPDKPEWTVTKTLTIGKSPPTADVPGAPWRFTAGGILGLLLLTAGIAGVAFAAVASRTPLRKESGGLGFAALAVGAVLLLQSRVGSGTTVIKLPSANPVPASAASIARGKDVFQTYCVACHGVGGQGNGPAAAGLFPPVADLTSAHSRTHLDQDFFYWIQNGIQGSAMPAFKDKLKDDQIWDVINYVRVVFQGGPVGGTGATPPSRAVSSDVEPGTPATAGGLTVTMLPTRETRGPTTLTFAVVAGTNPVNGAGVTVAAQPPHVGTPPVPILAQQASPGHYTATLDLNQSGQWQVAVQVAGPTIGVGVFRFVLTVP